MHILDFSIVTHTHLFFRVVSIATGVFGYGIAEMAKSCGAIVEVVDFQYDETFGEDALSLSACHFCWLLIPVFENR